MAPLRRLGPWTGSLRLGFATAVVAAFAAALIVSGCGGGGTGGGSTSTSAAKGSEHAPSTLAPGPATPALPPTGIRPDPRGVRVIKAWSSALRRGDVRAAAAYFRLPSEFVNGIGSGRLEQVVRIRTRAEAEAVNASLPCGARFLSAERRGIYVNALFRLTGRPGLGGSNCGAGAGQTARTNFLIVRGRIVRWIRAPDQPGDNGTPGNPPGNGTPGVPPTSTGPAPVV
jgi:hypothetical protein